MLKELARAREIHVLPMPEGKNVTETDEGFLQVANAIVWSVGVMPYPQADGTVRYEFTPPEELQDPETIASFRYLPLTDGHPPYKRANDGSIDRNDPFNGLITPETEPKQGIGARIGATGKDPVFDGRNLRIDMAVHAKQGIQSAKRGRRGLSPGYRYQLAPVTPELAQKYGFTAVGDGWTFEGKPVTHVKQRIRGNHIALVDKPRNGPQARIQFDGQTIEVGIDGEDDETPPSTTEKTMKVKLKNGCEYEVPPEVAAQMAADGETIDTLTNEKKDLAAKLATAEGTIVAKDGEIAALPGKIREQATARAAVLDKSKKILGEMAFAAIGTDSEDAVFMKAAIGKALPNVKLEGKDDAFVKGLFEGLTAGDGETNAQKQMRIVNGGAHPGNGRDGDDEAPRRKLDGRQQLHQRNANAYKATGK